MVQHHQKNSEGTELEKNLKHRINSIEHRLMERLETSLIDALSEENTRKFQHLSVDGFFIHLRKKCTLDYSKEQET
jgi:hypothetical protein